MGLEVAKALANRGDWHVHLLDLNAERGHEAAKALGDNATFHQTNVLDYHSLANTFQKVYDTSARLDFCFANAGIVERFNFYHHHPPGRPPPPPDQTVIDINLRGAIHTVWLSQHYFRLSTTGGHDKCLVLTGSVGSLYPVPVSPSYAAAKHGVLGLTRSIATHFYQHDGIRVNAILPGTVRTNLLDTTAWDTFPDQAFVPIENVARAVLGLIDGSLTELGINDHEIGGVVGGGRVYGKAIELSGPNFFLREHPEYCDEHMRKCMTATDRETYA